MKWSENQLQAITERKKNILVSAAAGSGKTAVLVERIKQLLIKDGIGIDKMLIVTFTNAAAGEMRERIANAILEELSHCREHKHEKFLRNQLNLIHRANISTFHSFCIEIIRKYFYLINIEPNFKLCDEAQKNILQNEALEELMDIQFEEQEQAFIEFADCFASDRDDSDIKNMILHTFNFIQSMPIPFEWLKEKVEALNIKEEEFLNSDIYKSLKDDTLFQIRKAEKILNKALMLSNNKTGPYHYIPIIENDLIQLEEYKALLLQDNFSSMCQQEFSFLRLPSKSDSLIDLNTKEAVKTLRTEAKKVLSEIAETLGAKTIDKHIQDLNHVYPYAVYLQKLVKAFYELYQQKKNEKDLLDFNDLEHFAIKILSEEEVAKEYQQKFCHIFIDEYQDSNLVQETLINKIKREDNLFMVGDVKQSIYRFRLADPSIFINKYDTYKEQIDTHNIKIDLNKNFRSKNQVINGINYIFKHLMKKESCEIEYDQEAFLYKGLEYEEKNDLSSKVILLEHDAANEELDDNLKDMIKAEVEALSAARQIKQSLGTVIFDSKKGKERPLVYKDIVILLRTVRGWMQIYYETLLKENIPVYMDAGEGYFETVEVGIFLNLISLIDNKKQDIPLLSVLRSPIGNFTTEELVNIRLAYKNIAYHQAFEEYSKDGPDLLLKNKCQHLLKKIETWKEKGTYLPIDEFLWNLLKETGFYTYITALPGGKKRQGNMLILMEKAKQFQNTTMKGLFEFLQFIEQAKKTSNSIHTAKVIGEYDDVVRIMSIHKSKGLEFPFVIVGGLGKMFNKRSYLSKLTFHKDIGIGLKKIDPMLNISSSIINQRIINKKYEKELLSEELRILYVALTRAQDQLVLLGTLSDVRRSILKWQLKDVTFIHDAQCYMDWIMPVLLKHHSCKATIQSYLEEDIIDQSEIEQDDSTWNISIYNHQDIKQLNIKKSTSEEYIKEIFSQGFNHSSKKYKQYVQDKLEWAYDYSIASNLPVKMTVTEIRRLSENKVRYEESDIPNLITHPSFISDKKLFSALERGTFIHIIMQHIHLKKTNTLEEIKEQIQQMVNQELIRQEEADTVDVNHIFNFFQSDIGIRMKRSKNVNREVSFNLVKKVKEIMPDIDNIREEIMIQGTIDCYFREEDQYILLDYKNDAFYDNFFDEERLSHIIKKYKIQLELYKEALERIKHIPVKEAYLYLFNIGKAIKVF